MEEEEEIRPRLYKQFRESLKKAPSERFFDESELIEIFDYAGDLRDNYVRGEVLFCGARLYPDSEELLSRRALFYAESTDITDIFYSYMDDNSGEDHNSVLWQLSRLLRDAPAPEAVELSLDEIVNEATRLSDEEVIRLVRLAGILGVTSWIKTRMDILRAKADYLPAMLFEAAQTFCDNKDYESASQLYEELTALEPFDGFFWALSAWCYGQLDKTEEAATAFDFARNLDNIHADTAATLMETAMLFLPDYREEAVTIGRKALQDEPENFELMRSLVALMASIGSDAYISEAVKILQRYAGEHPVDWEPVYMVYKLGRVTEANDMFSSFMMASSNRRMTVADAETIAAQLIADNSFISACNFIGACSVHEIFSPHLHVLLLSALHSLGDFSACLDAMLREQNIFDLIEYYPQDGVTAATIYHDCLLNSNRRKEADDFAVAVRRFVRKLKPKDSVEQILFKGLATLGKR